MLDQLPLIMVPFLIAFFQVLLSVLALGLLPALWIFARRGHYGLLWRWTVFTLICIAAAAYGLPEAHDAWKTYTVKGFKDVAMWMGYFASALFAPMVLPEPLRLARRRLRHERPADRMRRGYRLPR